MADYFTYFSLLVPLPSAAAQETALALHNNVLSSRRGDAPAPALPDAFDETIIENWNFEAEAKAPQPGQWGLWLHSQEGGIEAVCVFIQHLLKEFNREGRVSFEWSNDCTKPRLDAYGGGAALITATEIKTMNTADWVRQQAGTDHLFSPHTQCCVRCGQHAADAAVENRPCKP